MLIVNADDWGRNKEATDSALVCVRNKRVSSTSAMVFMEDSERAAKLAKDYDIDVGLHLNLTEDFTHPNVSPALREAHSQVARFLRCNKYALVIYHPFLRKQFALLYHAQMDEFDRLYGKAPSHVDGHQHMHLATNMLLDQVIPLGTKVRRNFSFALGEKGVIQRSYRQLVDNYLRPRYRTTDYFFALDHYLPPQRMQHPLGLAKKYSVEVMTHPERSREYEALMSEEFARVVSGVELANYSSL